MQVLIVKLQHRRNAKSTSKIKLADIERHKN